MSVTLHLACAVVGLLFLATSIFLEFRAGPGRLSRIIGATGVAFVATAKWYLGAGLILAVVTLGVVRSHKRARSRTNV